VKTIVTLSVLQTHDEAVEHIMFRRRMFDNYCLLFTVKVRKGYGKTVVVHTVSLRPGWHHE
jgi:hypothetical protein